VSKFKVCRVRSRVGTKNIAIGPDPVGTTLRSLVLYVGLTFSIAKIMTAVVTTVIKVSFLKALLSSLRLTCLEHPLTLTCSP
jgi:hypothetical protein